jgi:two-component system sensor histidine kinase FlrB
MTALSTVERAPAQSLELAEAMQRLAGISASLSASYDRLAEHARHVEGELVTANAALAAKVAELDALRAHLEGILQALPLGVVVRDASGRIVRVNAAASALLEARAEELVGARDHAWLAGPDADGDARERFLGDGRRAVVAERSSPITGASGAAEASVQILDDRTELVELAERVHKLDKMAALGTMAGGIAHEIRNPMNAMLGFAELLKRELEASTRAYRFASRISEGVAEADAIITNLMSLSAPQKLLRTRVDARAITEEALELAVPAGADASRWERTHAVPSVVLSADAVKLRQALRNLVANALQAQPDGGRVHVALEHAEGEVAFHVTDRGPGIAPGVRGRLGDPFFTTRAEGTGLGLSLVHTIAELHGGRLEVCPHPPSCPHGQGRGAHVVLRIPLQTSEKQ